MEVNTWCMCVCMHVCVYVHVCFCMFRGKFPVFWLGGLVKVLTLDHLAAQACEFQLHLAKIRES